MTPFLIALLVALAYPGDQTARFWLVDREPSTPQTFLTRDFRAHLLQTVPADTIEAGRPFIVNLPDSIRGLEVLDYSGIRLPALSMLRDRSFFWRTRIQDRGDHEIWFRAQLDQAEVDSISVRVHLR